MLRQEGGQRRLLSNGLLRQSIDRLYASEHVHRLCISRNPDPPFAILVYKLHNPHPPYPFGPARCVHR